MKAKHLLLAFAALLAAIALWLARPARHADASRKPSADLGAKPPPGASKNSQSLNPSARLSPPDPIRRFREFTPEQRVEFARKGHGPGG